MLEAVVLEHGLSSVELQMRQDAVDRLQKFISQFKGTCHVLLVRRIINTLSPKPAM